MSCFVFFIGMFCHDFRVIQFLKIFSLAGFSVCVFENWCTISAVTAVLQLSSATLIELALLKKFVGLVLQKSGQIFSVSTPGDFFHFLSQMFNILFSSSALTIMALTFTFQLCFKTPFFFICRSVYISSSHPMFSDIFFQDIPHHTYLINILNITFLNRSHSLDSLVTFLLLAFIGCEVWLTLQIVGLDQCLCLI